ncbi:MAG TPA: lysophospholipid acyltransferase family protein [Acidimicrobiales bacterium]|jgi:1-acyl-sn-glycerol-3-phosphate acyltransferase|nr:lysophospholipid acyltransferase family protein [Acidimicrobiales bacterium]
MAYWILKAILTPVFYVLWQVKVEGREHIPRRGPVVLAANHQSFCDSFFLPLVLRRRVTYVAKSEYFESWHTSWFFRAAGQIPMNRGGGDASQRALDTARDVLNSGAILGIYPEGTRAPDHRLHKGHTGVARLALGCGVPVVPVGLVGTRGVQPPGNRLMRPFHAVTIRFGPPLDVGKVAPTGPSQNGSHQNGSHPNGEPDPERLREATDELMRAIATLSGQEYVDHYANRAAARNGSETARSH